MLPCWYLAQAIRSAESKVSGCSGPKFVEARAHIARGFVEYFPSGDGIAASFGRVRNLEHSCHEFRDAVGTVTLPGNAAQLDGLRDHEGNQQRRHSRGNADADEMTPSILAQAIGGGRRTS